MQECTPVEPMRTFINEPYSPFFVSRTSRVPLLLTRLVRPSEDPPKSPDHTYESSVQAKRHSKHLICCHLDALPYPSYSWSMITDVQNTSFIWCLKRCCWLDIVHQQYRHVVCTSANQFGKAHYVIHLTVEGRNARLDRLRLSSTPL